MGNDTIINGTTHDTVIPRLIYPAPLEPGSQAAVGLTSTAMGDLAGISGAVSFLLDVSWHLLHTTTVAGDISHIRWSIRQLIPHSSVFGTDLIPVTSKCALLQSKYHTTSLGKAA